MSFLSVAVILLVTEGYDLSSPEHSANSAGQDNAEEARPLAAAKVIGLPAAAYRLGERRLEAPATKMREGRANPGPLQCKRRNLCVFRSFALHNLLGYRDSQIIRASKPTLQCSAPAAASSRSR